MAFNKLAAVFKWIFSRVGFIYALIALAAVLLIDFEAASSRIKIRRLNDGRPDMTALVSFGKGDLPADKLNWKPYLDYFSMVVKYMPAEEVTKMFLGLCEHHTGDPRKVAWGHIQRAAETHPFIFWSVYNAGVLAFERGDMGLAVRYLERALVLPPERAGAAIQGSTVYRQLMASPNFDIRIVEEINAVRENIHLLLAAANFYAKAHEKALAIAMHALNTTEVKDKEPFYFYAGAASMALGKPQDAMLFMGKCVELKSTNPQVYRYAGEIFKASGRMDLAGDVLRTAAALENRHKSGFPYPDRLRLRFF